MARYRQSVNHNGPAARQGKTAWSLPKQLLSLVSVHAIRFEMSTTPDMELSVCPEAAIVHRCLKHSPRVRKFFRWLSDLTAPQCRVAIRSWGQLDPPLQSALEMLLLGDLGEKSSTSAQSEEAQGLGTILTALYKQGQQFGWATNQEWALISLLPLYRAADDVDASTASRVARQRMAEWLCLLLLCHEIGEELVSLLNEPASFGTPPHAMLESRFNLHLEGIARRALDLVWEYSENEDQLNAPAQNALVEMPLSTLLHDVSQLHHWSHPASLWTIAHGMLGSHAAAPVLPRSWVDTTIPWHEVVSHSHRVLELLGTSSCRLPLELPLGMAVAAGDGEEAKSPSSGAPSLFDLLQKRQCEQKQQLHDERIKNSTAGTPSERWASKVLIAEMHSHNDPLLVRSLNKLLQQCKTADRPLSLAMLALQPLDPETQERLARQGSKNLIWQQKLVEYLRDLAPHAMPRAYWTANAELIVALVDVERGQATYGLREGLDGLVADKIGGQYESGGYNVHYFAGVAGVAPPLGMITSDRLIDAAYRCFRAASTHGSSLVKGIDVF
ncbi:MAG: hypothetical protein KatS3mg111_2489 [Pirellulaceae bacterium]|nr:MAG: hypothetical protein KatS3mg111_2489 [Pirellulaceae bacterium]